MSSQNCSSETPPNDSAGHISSSTSDPLRQPTRRRDLTVLAASSVSSALASARCRAAPRRPVAAGSASSRTGCGPVKSITVLAPGRSDRAGPPALAERSGLADRPEDGGEVLLLLAGTRLSAGRPRSAAWTRGPRGLLLEWEG